MNRYQKGSIRTWLLAWCIAMFCMLCMPDTVRASEERYSFGHFYYHLHEGYVSVCGYLGREVKVEIPSSIGGKPVSEIESGSFEGCNSLEEITVPDTVVMVYEDSFTGASSLRKIISYTEGVTIQVPDGVSVEYPAGQVQNGSQTEEKNQHGTEGNTGGESDNTANIDTASKGDPASSVEPGNTADGSLNTPEEKSPGSSGEKQTGLGESAHEETDQGTDTGHSKETKVKQNVGEEENIKVTDDPADGDSADEVMPDTEIEDETGDTVDETGDTAAAQTMHSHENQSERGSSKLTLPILSVMIIAGAIMFVVNKSKTGRKSREKK